MPTVKLTETVRRLHDICENVATGGPAGYEAYESARREVLEESALAGAMPEWLRRARSGSQYWAFIKSSFSTYAERRDFLTREFDVLHAIAEMGGEGPIVHTVSLLGLQGTSESVQAAWSKCLERISRDPDGAITAARTLLESSCKSILEDCDVSLTGREDLPRLYGLVAMQLGLAPSQHEQKIFKQILGGCQSVVEGLGTLRNKLGDAHGTGRKSIRPSSRHARLAVNLAGSMTLFLVETQKARVCREKV